MADLFTWCGLIYIALYAAEGPVRYVLYLFGEDSAIFVRDGLILIPLAALFAARALRLATHPAYWVFAILIAFHGLVLIGNIGSFLGAAFGAKILVNLLFGFLVAALLLAPTRKVWMFFFAVWAVTLVGLALDKFVLTFPWIGIKTVIGDLTVDVSRDWEIQDAFSRRVAGFTRSSISAAAFVPLIAIVLITNMRSFAGRCLIAAISAGAVFLTTQKGALIAFVPVAALICWPSDGPRRQVMLRVLCLVFLVLAVALPLVTQGLFMDADAGVFSTESIRLRVVDTWPRAMEWISQHGLFVFGVGLGGIGSAQRIFAPDSFNPTDNLFLLMYAYFGVFALVYLAAAAVLIVRPVTGSSRRADTALAILAFEFGYGCVLSVLEDQMLSLFLGAAIGLLFRETRRKAMGAGRIFRPALGPPPALLPTVAR